MTNTKCKKKIMLLIINIQSGQRSNKYDLYVNVHSLLIIYCCVICYHIFVLNNNFVEIQMQPAKIL